MSEKFSATAQRIREELVQIEKVVERTLRAWQFFQTSSDELYTDSVALNLHGFYNGLELLFEMIVTTIDETQLQGAKWHQTLLAQMLVEIPNLRPAVLSEDSRRILNNYRGFRHVVRHTYALQFDAEQLQPLVEKLPEVFTQVRSELLTFATFLESRDE